MAQPSFQGLYLFILLKVILECRGNVYLSGYKQEDVALSCLDTNVTGSSSNRFRWSKYATGSSPTIIFDWPKKSQDTKRVVFGEDQNGKTCLYLKNLQKSDAGMYRWETWDGWDIVLVQNISLKIKDCKVQQAVKTAPGKSVKIDCQEYATPDQQALSNISWAKLKGSNRISVDSERVQMNGTYLAIQSAKASDSGWYRCTYTLGETQRCSDINLRIQDPLDSFEATTATVPPVTTAEEVLMVRVTVQIAGPGERNETLIPAVVSVAGVILLLAALAGFFIHRRRKTQSPTRPIQMRAAVSSDAYENLTLPYSPHAGDRVNSLYQFPEESVLTFKY